MQKLILPIILLTIIAYYSGCKKKTGDPADPKFAISDTFMRYITFDTVKKQQVIDKLKLTGKVTFDENEVVRIYPFVGGKIQSLDVDLGDFVKQGQTLAIIRSFETADYASQLIQAESNAEVARKSADAAQSSYKNGLISEKDYIMAQNDLKKAMGELDKIKNILNLIGEESGKNYMA